MAGKEPKAKADKRVLYVGGLAEEVDDKLVHAAFIPFGEIKQIDLPMDQTKQVRAKPPRPRTLASYGSSSPPKPALLLIFLPVRTPP